MAGVVPCHTSIACTTLDDFVTRKLLEALQPAAVELSLQVIEDEVTRRQQLETTRVHHVQQAQYQVDLAERRYRNVDPANRLVAGSLEQQWESALQDLTAAETLLAEFREHQSVTLTDDDRQQLQQACGDVAAQWNTQAVMKQKKEIIRLMIDRVVVHVHDNSERVTVAIHWAGGFESCHQITRTVTKFAQLENYAELLQRTLELTLQGMRSPNVAEVLEREGYRSPRLRKRISADMVKVLLKDADCEQQLRNPTVQEGHWKSRDLARELSIPEKRLKDWVTRGWVSAVQRPFGRTWVIYADKAELTRLRQLVTSQVGQGRPGPKQSLRTPARIPRKTQ